MWDEAVDGATVVPASVSGRLNRGPAVGFGIARTSQASTAMATGMQARPKTRMPMRMPLPKRRKVDRAGIIKLDPEVRSLGWWLRP